MNYAKKDNKVYFVKNMDEITLKDDKDLFIVKLDGLELHTFDEFEKTARKAFQTPTDESMFWLDEPGNPFVGWITELEWLLDAGFNSFALIVENWSKTLDREPQREKEIEFLLFIFQDICDFWGYEVVKCVSYGEPKDFNIYLVG
ncbi:hypothetical protein [Helicobacter trogontum]|uniref:Barstar (barnase inhibitor) domain-containing protein n=1 Tax=Helicobacter trogontum TaxID=50960 RepID=A0A4U8T7D2_9HELI|nr:hypothetical protein [Helicobacter trogontum]TLD95485.1 hypothetical protein LS80_009240 [Helicobacter trogontum]